MLNIEEPLEYYDKAYKVISVVPCDREHIFQANIRHKNWGDDYFRFDRRTGLSPDFNTYPGDNPSRVRPKSKVGNVTRFSVWAGFQDWPKEKWVKVSDDFELGSDANDQAKDKTTKARETGSPWRFKVRREVLEAPIYDYHEWAEFRFASGEYKPVPWADEPWVIKEHYCRRSNESEEYVAFFEDPSYGQQDRSSQLTVGSYLNRYHSDVLSPQEIERWVTLYDGEAELEITPSEPEAIIAAYQTGVGSCMSYSKDQYFHGISIHPVGVYGAGDLCVALMRKNGRVKGRALVWPEKKVAGRIYGDINRMKNLLRANGYTCDAERQNMEAYGEGGLNGARILKIPIDGYTNGYIMPYIDFHYQIKDEGEYFILHRDGHCTAHNTNGTIEYPFGDEIDDYDACDERECDCHAYCADCSEWTYRDEMQRINGELMCSNCVDSYTQCDECGDYVESTYTVVDANNTSNITHFDVCFECRDSIATYYEGNYCSNETLTENSDGELVPTQQLEAVE